VVAETDDVAAPEPTTSCQGGLPEERKGQMLGRNGDRKVTTRCAAVKIVPRDARELAKASTTGMTSGATEATSSEQSWAK
jgi:hypothetical protein